MENDPLFKKSSHSSYCHTGVPAFEVTEAALRLSLVLLLCLFPVLDAVASTGSTPQVWFAPLDPLLRPEVGYAGSPEYMDLFQTGAPWATAATHVQVFKMYPQWIFGATDAQLQTMFADLDRRGIQLALEFGVLAPTSYTVCGSGVEGFGGEALGVAADRIRRNGGTLKILAMDEPVFFGSMYTGTNACRWSIQDAAKNAVANLRALKAIFPNVLVGDIEPVPAPDVPDWLSKYQEFMDAYRNANGANLDFFHSDVLWQLSTWRDSVDDLRRGARVRGIPFGVIYNGNAEDPTDADWLLHAGQHMTDYEFGAGQPDHVIFQSWHAQPKRLLPETDAVSFTALINRYFRRRTRLTLRRDGDVWSGQLTDDSGRALAGSTVSLTATLISGNPIFQAYSISGVPPAGTKTVVVGMRMNSECNGCRADNDIMLYSIEYREGNGSNLVPDSDFSKGMSGWGFGGSGTAVLEPNDRGSGSALHVRVSSSQTGMLNKDSFAVAGSAFTSTFNAKVSPSSAGGGYFGLFFLGDKGEISRNIIPFVPATIQLAPATTGDDGTFSISGLALPSGSEFRIEGTYEGSASYWPAAIDIGPGSIPFNLAERGGATSVSTGASTTTRSGYGRIQPNGGSTPSGLAIFGFRQNSTLVSETGVPALLPVRSARIYAEMSESIHTGLAIANPNSAAATISFFFTDSAGNDTKPGQTTIAPHAQFAVFLNEAPFGGLASFQGTFSFSSDLPVGVIALRGLVNERGESLMSTLPVIDTSLAAAGPMQLVPHFADGGGWRTQIVLVNPSNSVMTGELQFLNTGGSAATVLLNGQEGSNFSYSVAPRSARKWSTGMLPPATLTGSIRVVAATGDAPAPLVIFSYKPGGITVSEAGVSVANSTALRLYVESSGAPGRPENIQSGIAIANPSGSSATITLELTQLDGSSIAGSWPAVITLPGLGQTSKLLSELFPSLPGSFKGVLRIATNSPGVSSVGLRARYNERGDFLITTTPPGTEGDSASSAELEFPHLADGGGYTTQLILFSGTQGPLVSGALRLYDSSGKPLNLTLR